MRAALICLPLPGEPDSPVVAGRSIPHRQLDFALACGCKTILVHGSGLSELALALRHATEKAGARFVQLSGARALAGALADGDSLLVMQAALLPESAKLRDLLAEGHHILTIPAGVSVPADFERIDLHRNWAGALTMPCDLLAELWRLPEDVALPSALLRIALQARIADARIPEQLLKSGEWVLVHDQAEAERLAPGWLRRAIGAPPKGALSRAIAASLLGAGGGALANHGRLHSILLALYTLALALSLAAASILRPAGGFALLALAALTAEMILGAVRLRAAPFGNGRAWRHLRKPVDLALFGIAAMSYGGMWYHEIFAAFVLVAGLILLDGQGLRQPFVTLRDRMFVSLLLAVAAMFGFTEAAILLAAGMFLAANLAFGAQSRR